MRNYTKKASLSTNNTVGIYLQEIGRVPLLTCEQEILFAQQLQLRRIILAASEKLTVELKRTPTRTELALQMQLSEHELLSRLNRGKQAKQKLMAANIRLVVSIAKRYQRRNLELLDLIQEGTLGLDTGVEKFDPNLGYRLSTYVYHWIRQSIARAIAEQGRTIRLPVNIHEKLNKIKYIQRELVQKLGRIPNTAEIADALVLEPDKIQEYLLLARQPLSLNVRVGTEQETQFQDLIEDSTYSNSYSQEPELLNQDIQDSLSTLSPREQEILTLHFGLAGNNQLSLSEIGQRMGISRERVRQIEKEALNFLKQKLISYQVG